MVVRVRDELGGLDGVDLLRGDTGVLRGLVGVDFLHGVLSDWVEMDFDGVED